MTLKTGVKLEEELACGFENDMRNTANFHKSTWECRKRDFDGILMSQLENA